MFARRTRPPTFSSGMSPLSHGHFKTSTSTPRSCVCFCIYHCLACWPIVRAWPLRALCLPHPETNWCWCVCVWRRDQHVFRCVFLVGICLAFAEIMKFCLMFGQFSRQGSFLSFSKSKIRQRHVMVVVVSLSFGNAYRLFLQ